MSEQSQRAFHIRSDKCKCKCTIAVKIITAFQFSVSVMASADERNVSVSIERSEERNLVIELQNQQSRGSTEPEIVGDQSTVTTKTSVSYPKWFLPILCDTVPTSETKAIDKVPITILKSTEERKDCFHPMVVSIGPYHNQDEDEDKNPKFAQVEKLKASIAKEFIGGETEKLQKFKKVSRNARACYEKASTVYLSDDQFTRMMFLDGCFVLHFIDCVVNKKYGETKMKTDQIMFVLRDLFLLENQLPFLVLEALMNFRHDEKLWLDHIHNFLSIRHKFQSTSPEEYGCKPAHLLDLLHKKFIGHAEKQGKPSETSANTHNDCQSFRSVIELKQLGVKFKKSQGRTLRDIEFKDHLTSADLFLPQLVVDDFTKSMFLNLVAYEASPDGPNDYVVASYIVFLDALIDHPEDVKELRSKNILHNLLGSDQQVVDLFNELATNLVQSPFEYHDAKKKIEDHCRKRIPKWVADLKRTHFRNPWTILSLFVAGAIFLVTFAQAVHAIIHKGSEEERKAPTPSRKVHYFG